MTSYNVGDGDLVMQINNPKAFQYYEGFGYDKNTYDNGEVTIFVKLDGQDYKKWGRKLFDADFTQKNSFDIPVIPKNDLKINDTDNPNHNILLADEGNSAGTQNTLMMYTLAQIYDKIPAGNHTFEVEVWTANYDGARNKGKLPIAQGKLDFTVTAEGKVKAKSISQIALPKHFDSNKALDAKMLARVKTNYAEDGVVVYDWMKVSDYLYNRNRFGEILDRTYKADIILKSNDVCWWARNIEYIEANEGTDKYGESKLNQGTLKPEFNDASTRYVPIPCSRVKK